MNAVENPPGAVRSYSCRPHFSTKGNNEGGGYFHGCYDSCGINLNIESINYQKMIVHQVNCIN
uniref:Uncharacterized protein n=1 Tax=Kalanchoe fedtschenkoi TaxID=63787 RepID=A0A7N0SXN2_KALFE